jgi:hypothetical protein
MVLATVKDFVIASNTQAAILAGINSAYTWLVGNAPNYNNGTSKLAWTIDATRGSTIPVVLEIIVSNQTITQKIWLASSYNISTGVGSNNDSYQVTVTLTSSIGSIITAAKHSTFGALAFTEVGYGNFKNTILYTKNALASISSEWVNDNNWSKTFNGINFEKFYYCGSNPYNQVNPSSSYYLQLIGSTSYDWTTKSLITLLPILINNLLIVDNTRSYGLLFSLPSEVYALRPSTLPKVGLENYVDPAQPGKYWLAIAISNGVAIVVEYSGVKEV